MKWPKKICLYIGKDLLLTRTPSGKKILHGPALVLDFVAEVERRWQKCGEIEAAEAAPPEGKP